MTTWLVFFKLPIWAILDSYWSEIRKWLNEVKNKLIHSTLQRFDFYSDKDHVMFLGIINYIRLFEIYYIIYLIWKLYNDDHQRWNWCEKPRWPNETIDTATTMIPIITHDFDFCSVICFDVILPMTYYSASQMWWHPFWPGSLWKLTLPLSV